MGAIHIEANIEDVADVVLLPGDPLRAKYIAETFLTDIKLINKVRNMFGYTGYYKDKRITVIGSGMGIPSVGIYSYELYNYYNVKRIIRIGTAGSFNKNIKLLDVVLAKNSYSTSSFAYVWGKETSNVINSSEKLNNDILKKADELNIKLTYGTIMTGDVFSVYANIDHILEKVPEHIDILAMEMEAFGLFHVANICGKEAACLTTIVDSKYSEEMVSEEDKQKNLNEMITLALESI